MLAIVRQFCQPSASPTTIDTAQIFSNMIQEFYGRISGDTNESRDDNDCLDPVDVDVDVGFTRQQDAFEFFTFLLESLHNAFQSSSSTKDLTLSSQELETVFDERFRHLPALTNQCHSGQIYRLDDLLMLNASIQEKNDPNNDWNESCSNKIRKHVVDDASFLASQASLVSSPIAKLFHFRVRSEVFYHRKKTSSTTFQIHHCISLDISSTQSCSVENLLQQFFTTEVTTTDMDLIILLCNNIVAFLGD